MQDVYVNTSSAFQLAILKIIWCKQFVKIAKSVHSYSVHGHLLNGLHIIQINSGITSGRVLYGELLYSKILEVNLFAFVYRLFHEDFSPIDGVQVL